MSLTLGRNHWLSFSRDHVVTRFRRHPDKPHFLPGREDWPLRGVREIAGNTGLASNNAFSPGRPMLTTHPADIALQTDGPLPALPLMSGWIVANRRGWLNHPGICAGLS